VHRTSPTHRESFGRVDADAPALRSTDSAKCKKEWSAPINPHVREAINRIRADRQLRGSPFLFPSPNDPSKPLSKELASAWLRRAEALADVEHLEGGGWHPFRRGWATSRKHLPDVDVAAAGGWSDLTSLKTCYQQADQETMVAVVNGTSTLG
jgi:integrase